MALIEYAQGFLVALRQPTSVEHGLQTGMSIISRPRLINQPELGAAMRGTTKPMVIVCVAQT